MRSTGIRRGTGARYAAVAILTILGVIWLFAKSPVMEAYAYTQQQAKVTAATANIRADADSSSQALASVKSGDALTVTDEKTGTDGKVWFQVFVDANTKGYIRSDLIDAKVVGGGSNLIGGTSSEGGGSTGDAQTPTPPVDNTTGEITEVEPQSASVTNEQVRVRAGSNTTSSIVTTVKKDVVLTVTGQTTGSDGKTWYQVTFVADGKETTGFVRSDFVSLSGELVPKTDEPADVPKDNGGEDTPPVDSVPETKDWDTALEGENWYLINNLESKRYPINDLLTIAEQNALALEKSKAKVGTQTVIIVVLVILLVLTALGITLLIFKLKDLTEDGFDMGARQAARRRQQETARPAGSRPGQRPAGSGAQRPTGQKSEGSAGRPTSQRPMGNTGRPTGQRPEGNTQRPTGQRPDGSAQRPTGQRPEGNTQRPTGQRPEGNTGRPTGQRPEGSPQRLTGQRPEGNTQRPPSQRPEGSPQRPAGQRPEGSTQRPASQRPSGNGGSRPQALRSEENQRGPALDAVSPAFDMTGGGAEDKIARQTSQRLEEQRIQRQSVSGRPDASQPRKSKNFLADEEEFEFEFLNWDGEEDK